MTISRFRPIGPVRRMILVPIFALVASAGGCQSDEAPADAIPVPSGRVVTLIEIVSDIRGPEGATARFRFLAPGLSEDEVEAAATDMEALCNTFALARIDGVVPKPQQIIVSLSAAPVPFGEAAPDVVQFFEAYDVTGGSCVWSVF